MNKESFLRRKVPLIYLLLTVAVFACLGFYLVENRPKEVKVVASQFDYGSPVNRVRLNDYQLIHPLLYGDREEQDSRLQPLKQTINSFIEAKKDANILADASVYFRNMNDGGWFAINEQEGYTPASLQKLTIMMAWLKDAEQNPAVLDKMIYFDTHFSNLPSQNIKVFTLQEHKSYAAKDLLKYMIAYSDNDALNLLYRNMNNATYSKLFSDLELKVPNLEADEYTFTSKQYAIFFRILYNGTYLSHPLSEYGLRLLTQCTYHDGITRHLDSSITVAHKFGERNFGTSKQLHEFAIVYVNNHPYLLGIMTRGYDFGQLSEVLTGISDLVYAQMNPQSSGSSTEKNISDNSKHAVSTPPFHS